MTQQIVNVGTVAGDGTGDSGQTPFNKTNANFSELYKNAFFTGTDSGAVNAYVVGATPAPAAAVTLFTGLIVRFIPANPNNGPATLNFAGTGVVAIVGLVGAALLGGELAATGPAILEYNGTAWQILVGSPGSALYYKQTTAEIAASVTPTNYSIAPGIPERYGAVGNGTTDDTTALQNCFNANTLVQMTTAKTYAVQTVTFPLTVATRYFGNGATIKGISTNAQTCVVNVLTVAGAFYDLQTATANGATVPNVNYGCSVLLGGPTGNCQWNNFYHLYMTNAKRGLVIGCLPTAQTITNITAAASAVVTVSTVSAANPFTVGANINFAGVVGMTQINGATGTITAIGGASGAWTATVNINSSAYTAYSSGGTAIQAGSGLISENAIFNIGSIGVENPCCSNATEGFTHFSEPIFYSGHENWSGVSPNYTTARALEVFPGGGAVYAQGGELEIPNSTSGYAADLQACHLVGMYMETANPLHVVGDAVEIVGGSIYNLSSTTPAITIAATAGGAAGATPNTLQLNGVRLLRQAGTGAFAQVSMIDASAVTGTYQIVLNGSQSTEWNILTVGANVPLVKKPSSAAVNVVVKYRNHLLSQTNSDPNVYTVSNPGDSLYDGYGVVSAGVFLPFDRLGYTTNGWVLNLVAGGGTTMTSTTNTGPTGYNAGQITLAATGNFATVGKTQSSTLANLQATAQKCAPGDLFWASCWLNPTSGGNAKLVLRWFNLAGAELAMTTIADSGSITANAWNYVEGPSGSAPAGAAYVDAAVWANTTTVEVTDLRLRRAN